MRVILVRIGDLDRVLGRLLEVDAVDRGRKVTRRGKHGLVPLRSEVPEGLLDDVDHDYGEVSDGELAHREGLRTPYDRLCRSAREAGWDEVSVALLPARWERLGRLLVIGFPRELAGRETEAAGLYAEALGVEAVLVEEGPVTGVERRPSRRLVWGRGTSTVHREHGVEYEFDAARQMFSKGNVHERMRMGTLVGPGEVVVDMFAGIGYFSLPMAVMGSPSAIHACEIDPEAHGCLVRNVARNSVEGVVSPILGDCRDVAPRGVADRVVLGYVGGTEGFLDVAMEVLSPDGGVVHLHEKYGIDQVPSRPKAALVDAAERSGRSARMLSWREVKSYAPAIVHTVVDMEVR